MERQWIHRREHRLLQNSAAQRSSQGPADCMLAMAPAPSGTRKVKLSTVISQVDDTEIDLTPEAEMVKCFKR